MKKIVVVAPNPWSYQEILKRKDKYDFIFYECDFQKDKLSLLSKARLLWGINFDQEVNKLVNFARSIKADAILGVDEFISCLITTKACEVLGLPHNSLSLELTLQHKYYSRILQKKIVPEFVPDFSILQSQEEFRAPFFVKPIRGSASILAKKIKNEVEIKNIETLPFSKKLLLSSLLNQFESIAKKHADLDPVDSPWIKEEIITGIQLTLEGFVQENKNTTIGIVDSVMYPGSHLSFKQFDYPSKLPALVQERIKAISEKFIHEIGYKNGFYNIEFFYLPQTNELKIIEINPRMAFQFSDLYEKVDGINTFDVLISLALGERPHYQWSCGHYQSATSFVKRIFKDGLVKKVPSSQEISVVQSEFDARVLLQAQVGSKLSSDIFQDTESFRLMTVNLGGADQDELDQKYQRILRLLNFEIDHKETVPLTIYQRMLKWI